MTDLSDAIDIVGLINILRSGEGDSVAILCDNPDFNGQPDRVVVVNASWTGWQDERFGADTLLGALRNAASAKATHCPDEVTRDTQSCDVPDATVKRYGIHYDARGEYESPNGDFVHWSDYLSLAARLEHALNEPGKLGKGLPNDPDNVPNNENIGLEAAGTAAFREAQNIYRSDYDYFPLKNRWDNLGESARGGWRKIAAAAVRAALDEHTVASIIAPYFQDGYCAQDAARALLDNLGSTR